MRFPTATRHLIYITILLGLVHLAHPVRPSVLLKRSLLRRRLMEIPETLRPKRQLFREDIPRHRPLTGNTYYLHAGFPHPSRWHEGPQVIPPNPNPITHHHFHENHGLHHDLHNQNNHNDHNNNHVSHEHAISPIHQSQPHHHHYHHHHNGNYQSPEPVAISVVNSKTPHSGDIHSAIVHANGVGGGVIDNAIGNPIPSSPADQANFDPLISSILSGSPIKPAGKKKPKRPKPHTEPEPYLEYGLGGDGDYDTGFKQQISGPIHSVTGAPEVYQKEPERKPKTIIHYHPVTVGSIINFNDDNKPNVVTPSPISYGPPDHIPGVPLSPKDVMLSVADPFIKSPFKTVNGPPDFLDFGKDNNIQYGPPQHVPGVPLSSLDLTPMVPSYGPPVKPEPEGVPPYKVALPVIAHLHSGHPPPPPHHYPPKRYRGKPRGHHQHHLHLHHIHHPPPPLESPFYDAPVKHPVHLVHGHVPKFSPFPGPRFHSHTHQQHQHHYHHKSLWTW